MFSKRFVELREERNLLQSDVAKIFNVEQPTVSQWENNKRIPDSSMIIIIANFFDVSTDYLLGRSDNRNPSNGLYTKTITDEDGYSIEIKTEVPFSELSKEKQQDMIDVAMEKLFEVKKEIKEDKR